MSRSVFITMSRSLLLLTFAVLPRTGAAATESTPTFGQLWATDSLAKVARTAVLPAETEASGTVRMSGSCGEIVSGQAVFRPTSDRADIFTSAAS